MNDYWNDPPETPEPPCCKLCGEFLNQSPADPNAWACPICGWMLKVEPEPIQEPPPELTEAEKQAMWDDRMVNFGSKCPHGNEWFECDACDRESDFRHDADRERRHFGK